jgi:Carboxypeptidase regulatory-like domain
MAGYLIAQNQNGEIQLQVRDASGAVMEATGRLESSDTGINRRFHTNVQGRASLENLPSGSYRVELSRAGFATGSLTIELGAEKIISRTITMQPASQHFKTDVVSATPLNGADLTADQTDLLRHLRVAPSRDRRLSPGGLFLHRPLCRRGTFLLFERRSRNRPRHSIPQGI